MCAATGPLLLGIPGTASRRPGRPGTDLPPRLGKDKWGKWNRMTFRKMGVVCMCGCFNAYDCVCIYIYIYLYLYIYIYKYIYISDV